MGANFTQCNESHHYMIKSLVHCQIPLVESIRQIKDYIKQSDIRYDKEINKQRVKVSRLLDKVAFLKIKRLIT